MSSESRHLENNAPLRRDGVFIAPPLLRTDHKACPDAGSAIDEERRANIPMVKIAHDIYCFGIGSPDSKRYPGSPSWFMSGLAPSIL